MHNSCIFILLIDTRCHVQPCQRSSQTPTMYMYLSKASRSDFTTVGVALNDNGSRMGVEATTWSCPVKSWLVLEISDSLSSFCVISLSSCVGGLSEEVCLGRVCAASSAGSPQSLGKPSIQDGWQTMWQSGCCWCACACVTGLICDTSRMLCIAGNVKTTPYECLTTTHMNT